jgi:hypothetical protein
MLGRMFGWLSMSQEMMADGDHHISRPEQADQREAEGDISRTGYGNHVLFPKGKLYFNVYQKAPAMSSKLSPEHAPSTIDKTKNNV